MDKLHHFGCPVSQITLPEKFTYPFHYTPHPLSVMAAKEVQAYLHTRKDWESDLEQGRMFGVLIVQTLAGEIGYLAAFSGILAGKNLHDYFVPPVYNLQQPEGFFRIEEDRISAINTHIKELEADTKYTENKQRLADATRQAKQAIENFQTGMETARLKREERRRNNPDEAEQAALIRESQFQKAELKRLKQQWNNRIVTIQTETDTFERKIEQLKTERKTRSAALQQQLFKSSAY